MHFKGLLGRAIVTPMNAHKITTIKRPKQRRKEKEEKKRKSLNKKCKKITFHLFHEGLQFKFPGRGSIYLVCSLEINM